MPISSWELSVPTCLNQRSALSLSRVRAGVREVVGVPPLLRRCPRVASAAMHFGQRDEVVDVEITGIGEHAPVVGPLPPPGDDSATPLVECHGDGALGDQDLLPRVLAVVILIEPAAVEVPGVGDRRSGRPRPGRRLARQGLLRSGGSGIPLVSYRCGSLEQNVFKAYPFESSTTRY